MKKKDKKTSQSKRCIDHQKYRHMNSKDLKTDFEVLTGICRMIEQSAGGKEIFEKMLNLIGKSVEFSRASLFLLNKSKNQMEEAASVGKKVDLIDFVRFDAGLGLSAWVAKEKRPILLSNLHRKRSGDGIKSFLSIPLTLNGELFGVMNFGHIKERSFEPEEVRFLNLVSLPVTLSLERTFYHAEMETLRQELDQSRDCLRELRERIKQMQGRIPTSELLENLNEKIKTPLASIVENAEFLLNTFSTRQDDKSSPVPRKDLNTEFKRGLREIKNEVHQLTKSTEKLLKKGLTLPT